MYSSSFANKRCILFTPLSTCLTMRQLFSIDFILFSSKFLSLLPEKLRVFCFSAHQFHSLLEMTLTSPPSGKILALICFFYASYRMLWHQAKVKLQKLWILWCQAFRNSISKHKLIFNHFQITVTLNFGKQIEAN